MSMLEKICRKLYNISVLFPLEFVKSKFARQNGTLLRKYPSNPEDFDFTEQEAANYIYERLNSKKPLMISRFGSVELDAINMCLALKEKSICKRIKNFIEDKYDDFMFSQSKIAALKNNAGFFDADRKKLDLFTDLYLKSMTDIDILGSWHYKEKYVSQYMPIDVKKIPLWFLEPYFFDKPAWSRVLTGKKVLVVHPFTETIKKQYKKRDKLFHNPDILPIFELKTIKAVQTIAGETTNFNSWFDALEYMKNEISKVVDFDICIIGCGAYGLPLASYVKSLGRQAIHLGGATQILFGIRGKRWEEGYGTEFYQKMMNEYWVRPSIDEIPKNKNLVEEGCYW